MKSVRALLLASAAFLAAPGPALALDGVTASIKPVHSLVAGVMRGVGEPDLIVKGNASPHTYALRPSEAATLEKAKVIFWIGHDMEAFLDKALDSLAGNARIVELAEVDGVTLLPFREGGAFEAHEDEEEHAGHGHDHDHGHDDDHAGHAEQDGHDHAHGEHDMHFWLDPENAVVIARALAARLVEIKPEATAVFQANTERFASDMARLDKQLAVDMKRLEGKGFAVYHEGYAHFVERYGLHQLAHVTFTPERRPGARHMHHLRQQLRDNAECLFAEPYYDMRLANELARELDLRMGLLDPLGSQGVASYQQLLVNLAEAFSACLELE
jgi:zinc transport system substrate-binding protein